MNEIYLVQKMERKSFRKCAHNRIKVKDLDCYGHVETMWCESKITAVDNCRKYNHEQKYEVYFVRQITAFLK